MIKIALIDDKSYWLTQIKNSIKDNIEYSLLHFDSYKLAIWSHFDIILLDFFLDKDHLTGKDIINKLDWDIIIWFSSMEKCNDILINNWAHFWIKKIKSENNLKLKKLFSKIIKK